MILELEEVFLLVLMEAVQEVVLKVVFEAVEKEVLGAINLEPLVYQISLG